MAKKRKRPLTESEKMAQTNAANIAKMKAGRAKAIHIQKTAKTPAQGLRKLAGKTQTEKLAEKKRKTNRKKL